MLAGVVLVVIVIGAAISGSKTKTTPASTTSSSSAAAPTSMLGLSTAPSSTTSAEDDLPGPGAPTIAGSPIASGSGSASGPTACRTGAPLANVYHPNRLTVVNACMTVSGTVETVRSEADGDTHFDLALDSQFSNLLRPANFSGQHGWLVAEVVPADKPGCTPGQPPRPSSGSYDYGVCTGADEATPSVGQHVYVTGPYVLDEDHGGWAEIHPVWAVSIGVPAAAPSAQSPAAPPPTQGTAPPPTAAPSAGVKIVSVTSPVRRGSDASLVAQTAADGGCDLEVTLPSGAQSQSQGLGPGTADSTGRVQWTWRTGSRTTPGTATATVACGSSSASAQFEITS